MQKREILFGLQQKISQSMELLDNKLFVIGIVSSHNDKTIIGLIF
jgi:hypothetical protein